MSCLSSLLYVPTNSYGKSMSVVDCALQAFSVAHMLEKVLYVSR